MNNYYFELPELTLPFTANELFDENDLRLIESRYHELDIIDPNSPIINTTNCVWGVGDLNRAIADGSNDERLQISRRMPVAVGHAGTIRSKKYQKILWEYLNDTFHPDFLRPILNINQSGKKVLVTSLLCSKPSLNENSVNWHIECPRTAFPQKINMLRNHSFVNFRLYGDNETSNTKVQFASTTTEFENHVRYTIAEKFGNISDAADMLEIFNKEHNGVLLTPTYDVLVDNNAWGHHFTVQDEYNGVDNPFCINVNVWHRVFNASSPRCVLRFPGNPAYTYEYFKNLRLEGKFIR